ncbi:MAG TPA: lysophospholipid acyltransferase family protein [Acidimicrobiales bacterium]|nr:lysophospholipid acyltransferase family protein [Acidimicrobiales bacterium]
MAYWVVYWTLGPLLRFFFRVRVEGLEHIPRDGAVILASNHVSFCDSIFLPLVLKRRVTFVAKAEYFDDPKTAWFFRAVGQIPIRREGGSASQRALDTARGILNDGGLFGIYPEGTRSPDGRLYKGHTGVARLALQTKSPIVPVAMIGTAEAQPIGQAFPKLFMPITVKFGRPLSYERYASAADDPMVLRSITDEVMFELRELTGQEYVNHYAKRKDTESMPAAEQAKVA